MDFKGKLIQVARDWETGKFQITFQIDHDISGHLEELKENLLRITVRRWRDKRSLDANSYYWALIGKLAETLNISKPRCHNIMLRRYGQTMTIDGHGVYMRIPDTEKAEETALEASEYHIRPTSQVVTGNDGVNYRTYIMLIGSSQYDTAEMSHLIDGLINECESAGIETLPPDEINRMMEIYEANRRKVVEKNGK